MNQRAHMRMVLSSDAVCKAPPSFVGSQNMFVTGPAAKEKTWKLCTTLSGALGRAHEHYGTAACPGEEQMHSPRVDAPGSSMYAFEDLTSCPTALQLEAVAHFSDALVGKEAAARSRSASS